MPRGFNIRLSVGDPPRFRAYRYGTVTPTSRLTAVRIGGTIQWQRGMLDLGAWISAAVVDTLIQTTEITIRETAPYGPHPPSHPAWSGHEHMRDSINSTLRVGGKNVRGAPDAPSRSYAYGEVFVGFPWRFLEYGTIKMAPRPFVEPAYEAAMSQLGEIIAEIRGRFAGGGAQIGQRGGGAVGGGALGDIL